MELRDYQREALATDQVPGEGGAALIVPLLGLAGEAGTLLSEYKKYLRDGEAHRLHKERVAEELGDLWWYLSNVASKYGLDLGAIAEANLAKIRSRWPRRSHVRPDPTAAPTFDAGFPDQERLPRQFEVAIHEVQAGGAVGTAIGGRHPSRLRAKAGVTARPGLRSKIRQLGPVSLDLASRHAA